MKRIFLALSLVLLIPFIGCKKNVKVKPALVIKVVYQNTPIPYPKVYLKSGGMHNPQIPLSQYDREETGDENGTVIFGDLDQGDYFLYADVKRPDATASYGVIGARVVEKAAPNRYELVIYVN